MMSTKLHVPPKQTTVTVQVRPTSILLVARQEEQLRLPQPLLSTAFASSVPAVVLSQYDPTQTPEYTLLSLNGEVQHAELDNQLCVCC